MRKLVVVGLIALQGCASIVNSTRQSVGISSNPAGANVKVKAVFNSPTEETFKRKSWEGENIEPSCITPCFLELRRGINYLLTFTQEGREPASVSLYHKPSGWLWGDIFFGGIIGLVIDLSTGGGFKLKPENVDVVMQKK